MVNFWLSRGLICSFMIEEELLSSKSMKTSKLRDVIEEVMMEDQKYWKNIIPVISQSNILSENIVFLIVQDITGQMKK